MPTPVSALIHAATMVTAGVYLLMRSSPLIEYSSTVLMLCLWLGATTTVFSSLIGLFQQDIKKVIAYSTMSQLGMMVIAVGLSSYNIALFHLVNHAFYKALSEKNPEPNPINMSFVINPKNIENTAKIIKGKLIKISPSCACL